MKAYSICELSERLGVSESTIRRMVKRGEFPKPIQMSTRAVRWRESDVMEWLDRQRPSN